MKKNCPPPIPSAADDLLRLSANYYQEFDADYSLDVPAEAYGGWKQAEVEISRSRTAVVVMHAWNTGAPGQFPGWRRCVDYHPRADAICRDVMPPLLAAVRRSCIALFHVVADGRICRDYPGYKRAVQLAGPEPELEKIPASPEIEKIRRFKSEHSFVGKHNQADVNAGFAALDFPETARPRGDEGIAENTNQLFALCKASGINHLVYTGFAINWCLLFAPGGIHDMARRGFLCSVLRQAVTAVENKESARQELGKAMALWQVAMMFGLVFNVDDFIRKTKTHHQNDP